MPCVRGGRLRNVALAGDSAYTERAFLQVCLPQLLVHSCRRWCLRTDHDVCWEEEEFPELGLVQKRILIGGKHAPHWRIVVTELSSANQQQSCRSVTFSTKMGCAISVCRTKREPKSSRLDVLHGNDVSIERTIDDAAMEVRNRSPCDTTDLQKNTVFCLRW